MTESFDRFWSKVDKAGDCWEWTACRNAYGYGKFYFEGRVQAAHRVSYTTANGPIPIGLDIDHTCHNRACVRPAHLRAVSHSVNLQNRGGAPRNSSSGVWGVSWNRHAKKWQVKAKTRGLTRHGGYFVDLADAERAAVDFRASVFGGEA